MATGLWKPVSKPKALSEDKLIENILTRWQRPYPLEEHDVRVMCLDPIAVAYDRLSKWIDKQDFRERIYVHEVIEAIFMDRFGTKDTKFSITRITRKGVAINIPEDVPDAVYDQVVQMILETIHDPDQSDHTNNTV